MMQPAQNTSIKCDDVTHEYRYKGEIYKKNEIRGLGVVAQKDRNPN